MFVQEAMVRPGRELDAPHLQVDPAIREYIVPWHSSAGLGWVIFLETFVPVFHMVLSPIHANTAGDNPK